VQIFLFSFARSQEFGQVESSVTVKVKGTSRSQLPDYAGNSSVPSQWRHLYNRYSKDMMKVFPSPKHEVVEKVCLSWEKATIAHLRTRHEHFFRVWDVADYVVPPAENGAFFVTTNVVITPNQVSRNPRTKSHDLILWSRQKRLC